MQARLSSLSIFLLIAVLFSACIDPNEIIGNTGEATFSAEINGENFSVAGILVTAEYAENQGIATLGIAAAALPLSGVIKGFALAIVSTDSSGIAAGDIYTANSLSKAGGGEYVEEDGNSIDLKALSANTGVATITVTDIDFDTKLISGTFSFDGSDDDDLNTIYEIRDGEFKNVSFD